MVAFDPNMGVHRVARAILTYLEDADPGLDASSEIYTHAWYNGRERGVSIMRYSGSKPFAMIITFGECRNSNSIFVDRWFVPRVDAPTMNGPTLSDFSEAAYKKRWCCAPGLIGKAATYILNTLTDVTLMDAEQFG